MNQQIQEALTRSLTIILFTMGSQYKPLSSRIKSDIRITITDLGYHIWFMSTLNGKEQRIFKSQKPGIKKRFEQAYFELSALQDCGFPLVELYHPCKDAASFSYDIKVDWKVHGELGVSDGLGITDFVCTISRRINHLKEEIIKLSKKYPTESLTLVDTLKKVCYDALLYYDYEGDELNLGFITPLKTEFNKAPSLDMLAVDLQEAYKHSQAQLAKRHGIGEETAILETQEKSSESCPKIDYLGLKTVSETPVTAIRLDPVETIEDVTYISPSEVKPKLTGLQCEHLFKKLLLLEMNAPEEACIMITNILKDCVGITSITDKEIELIPLSKRPYNMVLQELMIGEVVFYKLSKIIEVINKHTVNLDELVKSTLSKVSFVNLFESADEKFKPFPDLKGETSNETLISNGDKMIISNKLGTKGVICEIIKDCDVSKESEIEDVEKIIDSKAILLRLTERQISDVNVAHGKRGIKALGVCGTYEYVNGFIMEEANRIGAKMIEESQYIDHSLIDNALPIESLTLQQLRQKAFHLKWKLNIISGDRAKHSDDPVNLDEMNEYRDIKARIKELEKDESDSAKGVGQTVLVKKPLIKQIGEFVPRDMFSEMGRRATEHLLLPRSNRENNAGKEFINNAIENNLGNIIAVGRDGRPSPMSQLTKLSDMIHLPPLDKEDEEMIVNMISEATGISHEEVLQDAQRNLFEETYDNRCTFFTKLITILYKYHPEDIFNLIEDFLEQLEAGSKLTETYADLKDNEDLLGTRKDILFNKLSYSLGLLNNFKVDDLLVGYLNALDIFIVRMHLTKEDDLYKELYSEEMVKLAELLDPSIKQVFTPRPNLSPVEHALDNMATLSNTLAEIKDVREEKLSYPTITDLSAIVQTPLNNCTSSRTSMACPNPDTEVVTDVIPLVVVESMTIITPPKDSDIVLSATLDSSTANHISHGYENRLNGEKPTCSYEVIFHHKFHISDDCDLDTEDYESIYHEEAKSEGEAVGLALTEHLLDSSQWVVDSFTVTKV
jgi:hypothetical protein